MIRCILYPGAHVFSTAGGKEQAAQILQEKVDDICNRIPAFKREIDWRRGQTSVGKDHCRYIFKNGSDFENIAARESSRGRRKHAGLIEECVGVDQQILQEVLIPMMNVSRQCLDGTVRKDEVLNQSQLYITTAGYKSTFSYQKLIQTLVQMVIEPGKAFVMGGTYRIPILVGLLPKSFLNDLKRDPTFNEAGFEREYESKWTGTVEGAFFDGEKINRNRILNAPEYEPTGRSSDQAYYVIGVDVGRKGCQTVATIIKVRPRSDGGSLKNIVNIYVFQGMHFGDQAIRLKKLYYQYHARRLVIDANGLGIGLMDDMVTRQVTEDGDMYPPFGVIGGNYNDAASDYKQFRTNDTEDDAIYAIKANASFDTEAYSILQTQIESGKIKFLIEQKEAKAKLLDKKVGQGMTPAQRDEYLMPFVMTDILKEEMLNLREESEGVNIKLKQASRSIGKDKFSSLLYGIYYVKEYEDSKKKRHKAKFSDMMFIS